MQCGAALVVVAFVAVLCQVSHADDSKKTALVAITNGTDEIEAVITISVLRRAGIQVTVGGLGCQTLFTSHDISINDDVQLSDEVGEFDVVVLPGGLAAAEKFSESAGVGKYLKKHDESGKLIAAICAGPLVLKRHGIGKGKKVTSGPKVEEEMKSGEYTYAEDRVVEDGNLITSRAPGTAFEFALAIVRHMVGEEKEKEVAAPLMLK